MLAFSEGTPFNVAPAHGTRGRCSLDTCPTRSTTKCKECGNKYTIEHDKASMVCHGEKLYRRSNVVLFCGASRRFCLEKSEEYFKIHHGTANQLLNHGMGRFGLPKCSALLVSPFAIPNSSGLPSLHLLPFCRTLHRKMHRQEAMCCRSES